MSETNGKLNGKAKKPKGKTCGDYGGVKFNGQPCGKAPGFGLKGEEKKNAKGLCKIHMLDKDGNSEADRGKAKFLEKFATAEHSMQVAAKHAGTNRITVFNWRKHDPEFDRAVRDLISRVDEVQVQKVEDAFLKRLINGTAYSAEYFFFLVNRSGGRWKHINRHEVTGKDGNAIEYKASDLSDNELANIVSRFTRATPN